MIKNKKSIFITTAILMFGVMSVGAYASSAYTSPAEAVAGLSGKSIEEIVATKTTSDVTYGQIASDLGVLDAFKVEMLELREDYINQKVANGILTQARANVAIQAMEDNLADCDGTGFAQGGNNLQAGNKVNQTTKTQSGNTNSRGAMGLGNQTGVCVNE